MLAFTLDIFCLTMSNLPWFIDLTFSFPMQYFSLQHQTLPSLPDISTTEHHFHFGPVTSFFLKLLVITLVSSPVAYCTPSDLWSFHFCWEFQPLLMAFLQGHTFGQTLGPKTSSKHRDAWESETGTTDYFSSQIFCFHLPELLNSLDMTLRSLAWLFSHWHIYPNSVLLFSGTGSWHLC